MKKIRFAPLNITLEVPAGTTILEAAREAGLSIESPCNGAGVCGKCKLPSAQIDPVGALLLKKVKPPRRNRLISWPARPVFRTISLCRWLKVKGTAP